MELEKINGWRGIKCPVIFCLDVVRIRLKKKNDQIDQNADTAQTGCEQIQNTGTNFALIELVAAKDAEEQAEKE